MTDTATVSAFNIYNHISRDGMVRDQTGYYVPLDSVIRIFMGHFIIIFMGHFQLECFTGIWLAEGEEKTPQLPYDVVLYIVSLFTWE